MQRTLYRAIAHAPVLVLAVYMPLVLLHTTATTDTLSVTSPVVELRALGDPERALARIAEESLTTPAALDALATDPRATPVEQLVAAHAPLLVTSQTELPSRNDTVIGLYWTATEARSDNARAMTIRYYYLFSDEDGGMPLAERMARYGQPFDRELVYRVTFLNGEPAMAYYQAPHHRHVRFEPEPGQRPVFAIASANHNFRLVRPGELERGRGARAIAYRPQRLTSSVYRDPDFLALAAREAWSQHGIDVTEYVYVTFSSESWAGEVTLAARTQGRWHHLLGTAAAGVVMPGDRRAGIAVGFTPLPADIVEVRLVSRGAGDEQPKITGVYIFRPLRQAI